MSRYVIIDGVLQKSTTALTRWAARAAQAKPIDNEEAKDVVALKEREKSDYEIIEGLEEHDAD